MSTVSSFKPTSFQQMMIEMMSNKQAMEEFHADIDMRLQEEIDIRSGQRPMLTMQEYTKMCKMMTTESIPGHQIATIESTEDPTSIFYINKYFPDNQIADKIRKAIQIKPTIEEQRQYNETFKANRLLNH